MLQSVITVILVLASIIYIARRLYNDIKKKKECDKCALMDAAKKAQQK